MNDFTELRKGLSWRARRALGLLANETPISTRMHWILYLHELVEHATTGRRRSAFTGKGKAFAKFLGLCLHEHPIQGPRHVYQPGKPREWSVATQICPACKASRRATGPDETRGYDAWAKDEP